MSTPASTPTDAPPAAAFSREELNMSNEEFAALERAMKKDEFKKLLNDYVEEISDPKVKAENEKYLMRLESESQTPKNRKLLKPVPVYCVKTKTVQKGRPIFINVCHGESWIDEAQVEVADKNDKNPSHAGGCSHKGASQLRWSIPYILSSFRDFKDGADRSCSAFDIVFNKATLEACERDKRMNLVLIQTALEATERKGEAPIEKKFKVLKKVKFKGGEPELLSLVLDETTRRPKRDDAGEADAAGNPRVSPAPSAPTSSKTNAEKGSGKKAHKKKRSRSSGPETPKHTIVYQDEVDLSQYMPSHVAKNVVLPKRPRCLLVKIELPKLRNASKIELDISKRQLVLQQLPLYSLELVLPHPVDEEHGSAQFDKHLRVLSVTLPVTPLSEDEIREMCAEVNSTVGSLPPSVGGAAGAAHAPLVREVLSDAAQIQGDTPGGGSQISSHAPLVREVLSDAAQVQGDTPGGASQISSTAPFVREVLSEAAKGQGGDTPDGGSEISRTAPLLREELSDAAQGQGGDTPDGSATSPVKSSESLADSTKQRKSIDVPPCSSMSRELPVLRAPVKSIAADICTLANIESGADEERQRSLTAAGEPPAKSHSLIEEVVDSSIPSKSQGAEALSESLERLSITGGSAESEEAPLDPDYTFRQTDSRLVLLFKHTAVDKASVRTDFRKDKLSLSFAAGVPRKLYRLSIAPRHFLSPSECSWSCTPSNLVVALAKSAPHGFWHKIEADEAAACCTFRR